MRDYGVELGIVEDKGTYIIHKISSLKYVLYSSPNSVNNDLDIKILENKDTCIIHTLCYCPKWCLIV